MAPWSNTKQYLQGEVVDHGGHTYEWGSADPSMGIEPPAGSWTQMDATPAQSGPSVAATDFTTETVPDPIRGGDATMQCLVLPADQPVLAVKVAGDAFPRWVLSGHGSLALGDGTFDPVDNGANLSSSTNGSDTDLYMTSGGAGIVNVNADLRMGYSHGYGLILFAPDNSMHRINVANDGTLSTEPVA
jgi:hypothetical protein